MINVLGGRRLPTWQQIGQGSTTMSIAGVGDFFGNGTDDILWHNASTGDVGVWTMNSGQATWHDLGITSTSFNAVKA